MTQNPLVVHEVAQNLVAATLSENMLGDMAQDRALKDRGRNSVTSAGFFATPTESAAVVVAIGFAACVQLAGALELASIAVVKELRERPEKIEALFEQWTRFRGAVLLDAKSVAAIANALSTDAFGDDHSLLAAVAAFKKDAEPSCILCARERAYWCRSCAQEAGRAEAAELDSRKLF